MAVLALDLGGTKLASAIFSNEGEILSRHSLTLDGRTGSEAGALIKSTIQHFLESGIIDSIGIAVPGICHQHSGTVWVPNIAGWDDYPLINELESVSKGIPVAMDSDRACSILGEWWKGNAGDCSDAIFMAVGTGIGAGILIDGKILRGANDIAGAIGWMALNKPFEEKYISCGNFEYHASGEGIAKITREWLVKHESYVGPLRNISSERINAHDLFRAYDARDELAIKVIEECISYWGMATANLVSIFNPEKIIFGGGVFGPAIPLIPQIQKEGAKWAQPISISRVKYEPSALGADAALYGAASLNLHSKI
ncbi:MAG: ROK family protein [Bacteroidetes bacterium]|nr:MAG: ROK family protein [Bacteroidota bacterium]